MQSITNTLVTLVGTALAGALALFLLAVLYCLIGWVKSFFVGDKVAYAEGTTMTASSAGNVDGTGGSAKSSSRGFPKLVIIAMLCLAVFACSSGSRVGTYELYTINGMSSREYAESQGYGNVSDEQAGLSITLDEDNDLYFETNGQTIHGRYSIDGDTLYCTFDTYTMGADTFTMQFEGSKLTLNNDGVNMVFKKR